MAELEDLFANATITKGELERRLIEACNDGIEAVVDFFLSFGVYVDAKDEYGRTGLIVSSIRGHNNIVTLALQHGANLNETDDDEFTSLMWACQNGHDVVVKTLLEHRADLNESSTFNLSALMIACRQGYQNVVNVLLEHGANVNSVGEGGKTPLMLACKAGHQKIVKLLVEHGADLERHDGYFNTALTFSGDCGDENIAKLLIESGANVNGGDEYGPTALIRMSGRGHEEVVKFLLKNGADVNRPDWKFSGDTPLISASKFGHRNIVQLLIDSGAELNMHDFYGMTALKYACQSGHECTVKILLENGALLNFSDSSQGVKAAITCACNYGQRNDAVVEHSSCVCGSRRSKVNTPLMWACSNAHVNVVRLLIEHHSDVNRKRLDGKTALMLSCGKKLGYCDCDFEEDKEQTCKKRCGEIVDMLLQHGADIDAQNDDGTSALMFAAMKNHKVCLEKLLAAGAKLELTDAGGLTVFGHAMKARHLDGLRILLTDGKLLKNGQLKSVHKRVHCSYVSLPALSFTMQEGLFQWEFCPLTHFQSVSSIALESGYWPGKMNYSSDMKLSPLIVSLLENETKQIKTFLENCYYFPEDYRTLCTDDYIKGLIPNKEILDEITRRPMSLFTWSFLTVSKSLSASGPAGLRGQRVKSLLIPGIFKTILMFGRNKAAA